jgi:hypothetical protein
MNLILSIPVIRNKQHARTGIKVSEAIMDFFVQSDPLLTIASLSTQFKIFQLYIMHELCGQQQTAAVHSCSTKSRCSPQMIGSDMWNLLCVWGIAIKEMISIGNCIDNSTGRS